MRRKECGGGSVGVVTALEMTLYPVRELYAGVLFFPIQRSAEVLHALLGYAEDEIVQLEACDAIG